MPPHSTSVRTTAALVTALALLGLTAGGAAGAPSQAREEGGLFDVRSALTAAPEAASAAQAQLRDSLGIQGVVDIDPLTGTPRVVAKLDGFLTGPSEADAKDVALDYVRAHAAVFTLDSDDLAALRLVRDYTDIGGTRHLVWAQTFDGIPAFDNDLRASVMRDGRLLAVMGSPRPDLAVASVSPEVDAVQALDFALAAAGADAAAPPIVSRASGASRATRFEDGHHAELVLFDTGSEVRLAWRVLALADSDEVFDTVVDASSGEVLRRANKVADAAGLAWDYFPGAPGAAGVGTQVSRDLTPWLGPATRLFGPNAHVFADLNDNDAVNSGEEIPPDVGGDWNYAFTQFGCGACSWKSSQPQSWQTNLGQNGTQVFYFLNTFHEWLEAPPIGFNAAAGNFEEGDRVRVKVLNGAGGPGGLPDEEHLNNAWMLTPPDGQPGLMAMFLYADPAEDVNAGDDARVVYHEYTHGLSNRLITFANGLGALDAFQSAAMGEAWSDWYGMDFVTDRGFEVDEAADGDVISAFQGDRTEPIDCTVDETPVPECDGEGTAGPGGYTYGDVGQITGFPEVHADGEIWAQTLWDLRRALGGPPARELVTRAMELSPTNPSFLDMRNSILLADLARFGPLSPFKELIWEVFAARGMGFFATTDSAQDTSPTEDFDLPPSETGTLTGIVTDRATGKPIRGALVWFGGHTQTLTETTTADGRYAFTEIPAGTYPQLFVSKAGYDLATFADITVRAPSIIRNAALRRNWASIPGGARLVSFTGPDTAEVCGFGPAAAFDGSLASGWASNLPAPSITVRLPAWIDMTHFGVDPGETCGDSNSASLRGYKVEVSKTGARGSYSLVKQSSFTREQGGKINIVDSPNRRAVRYVRFTMLSNWGDPSFVDLSEITVYGTPTPTCFGRPATKRGSSVRDLLEGTPGNDVIVGLDGSDRIRGRGGRDLVCGGDGNDSLSGGLGGDGLSGGNGNDWLYARDGVRERGLYGGPGTDRARKDASDRIVGVERRF
jgi:extracellular elastinolytic metalloproteinase